MGNRANFVVVADQDWRLYYAHWAGCRMLDALIGGPELALRYVASLRACPKNEWVSPVWADGGALIDLDRRRLLFFGDELMVTMAERRAMLAVLGAVWPGYAVGWAYDGPAELAGYVGAVWRDDPRPVDPTTKLTANRSALCQVVSVVDAGGRLRLWPLRWTFSQAWHGPALLDKLPGRGLTRMTLRTHPEGGVHIDVGRQTMGEWHTADELGICRELAGLWPGWQTESWGDGFEQQAERCGRALRLPELDLAAGADSARAWIRKRVYQSFADSPAGHIAELFKLLDPLAPGLVVSSDAAVNGGTRPTAAEWDRFAAACRELRTRPAQSA
ncbi:hypothetical protein ACAG26_02865 [Mycobacterium sp. pUA109]|uniref:hypothetical protein n=1 Tax=Mycobacterium sp. pUA109 TaxID=3238982 RepID=UPI00351B0249